MAYRYYISTNSGSTYSEVTLNAHPKQLIKFENASDCRYAYRRSFNEDIKISQKLNPTVFATLLSWLTDSTKFVTQILINTYRGDNLTGTLIHSGYFSITDCTIDTQNRVLTVKPFTNDNYTAIDNAQTVTFNILPTGANIYRPSGSPTALNWVNASIGSNAFDNWSATGGNAAGQVLVNTGIVRYARSPISLVAGIPVVLTLTANSGTLPNCHLIDNTFTECSGHAGLVYGPNSLTPTFTGAGYIEIYQVPSNSGWSFNSSITSYDYTLEISGYAQDLRSYLENLLGNAALMNTAYGTGKVKSTFLWNDGMPSSNIPLTIQSIMAINPTYYNYVTDGENLLNNLVLSCRASWSTGTPTTAFYFRDFMGALNAFLDVFWFIDSDGNFRIEHAYWFEDLRRLGLDLTDPVFAPDKIETDLKIYSFRKDILCWHEHWAINYNVNVDFIGNDIIYNIYATSQVTKEYRYGVISTDITYIQTAPLIDSLDGMILTNCDYLGPNNYGERAETGKITGVHQRNGHMALANLIDKYWRYQRFTKSGITSWGSLTINSAIPQILQEVKFPYSSDISYYQALKVSFGNGMISEDTHDLQSDFHDVKIYLNAY